MLSFHPHQRLSIPDIVAHPWIQQGEYATPQEVRAEFAQRHEQNKKAAQAEQDRKQAMKQHCQNQDRRTTVTDPKLGMIYRLFDESQAAGEQDDKTVFLRLKDYSPDTNTTHGFFTTNAPEDILQQLLQKMAAMEQDFNVSETHWRVNYSVRRQINRPPDGEEEVEEEAGEFVPVFEQADVQFEILRVPDSENMLYVQFKRKGGAAILFYESSKMHLD
jgi:hypothetical protein